MVHCSQWRICGLAVREHMKRSNCHLRGEWGQDEEGCVGWSLDTPWARGSFGGFDAHWLLWGFPMHSWWGNITDLCNKSSYDFRSDNVSMDLLFKDGFEFRRCGLFPNYFGISCWLLTLDRHRKMKERLGMTEMRKAANRVIFGEVSILNLDVNFCNTFDFVNSHLLHVGQCCYLVLMTSVAVDWRGSISRWSRSVAWHSGQVDVRKSEGTADRLKDESSDLKNITGTRDCLCWSFALSGKTDLIVSCIHICHMFVPSVLWHWWLGGRKSVRPVKELSDGVLVWLSVCIKVQMICIWSSWCHCHLIISCIIKILSGTYLLRLTWKEVAKWVQWLSYILKQIIIDIIL